MSKMQTKSLWPVGALLLVTFVATCSSAPDGDRVVIMPGLRQQPSFAHYSGYLRAGGDRHLHYWLVTSSKADPQKAPLVLWFNGGPGCSSLEGFLREHGPFIVNDQASLDPNPYAWNQLANVLYIEAPAGVGFSYSDSGVTKTNDTQVAEDNYLALKNFLHKFPEFVGRDLHISGESYGGVYVPTLAARVLQDTSLKLKGILIGNGINSWHLNSLSLLYFGYYHGLIGDQVWNSLQAACCAGVAAGQRCDFYAAAASKPECQKLVSQVDSSVTAGLDIYNLYKPCHGGSQLTGEQQSLVEQTVTSLRFRLSAPSMLRPISKKELAKRFLFRRGLGSFDHELRAGGVDPPCTNDTALTTYLNMPAPRFALHIRENLPEYSVCSELDYTMVYKDMTPVYQQLMKAKVPITLYNGDVDMACNFLQTEWFLQNLNMTVKSPRKAWYYQHPTEGKQIGGYVLQWTSGVTFLTVRGSGHMVPEDKPVQAYQLFSNYLQNSGW